MKKGMKLLTFALSLGLLIGISFASLAQSPPPPPGAHNLSGDQPAPGGTAPVGGGLILLVGMGIGYAIKRVVENRRKSI